MLRRIVLLAAVLAAAGCGTETGTKTVTVTSGPAASTPPATSEPPAVAPEPNGKVSGICDYSLGDLSGSDYSFIADVTIDNTGNIGIIATAKAVFNQLGSAPVVIKRPGVHVGIGRSKTVHLKRAASSTEIDLHQSANGKCDTDATITNTFGSAQ